MTKYNNFPESHSSGDFDIQLQGPNVLSLDKQRLRQLASGIRGHGITRDQLIDIAKVD